MTDLIRGERFGLSAWHDYDSFLPRVNWRDFTFVHVGGEVNGMMGYVEAEVGVLGLHIQVSYIFNAHTEFREDLKSRRDDLLSRYGHGDELSDASAVPSHEEPRP